MKPAASVRTSGVAVIWVLVVLAVLTVVMALVTHQGLAGLRLVERRQHQLQADWLARSGVELAAARLLADPAGYEGEIVEPVPGGKVRITVSKQDAAGVFVVTSEARWLVEEQTLVVRTATRTFRRVVENERPRLEVIARP